MRYELKTKDGRNITMIQGTPAVVFNGRLRLLGDFENPKPMPVFKVGDRVDILASFTIGYDEETGRPIMAKAGTVSEVVEGHFGLYSIHPDGYHNPFVDFRPWELAHPPITVKVARPR